MTSSSSPVRRVRFADFEIDFTTGELSRNGSKVNVPVQPLQILTTLLERPGELVTREELQQKLWADTFVDKEHSLNAAVKRLRALMEDDADNPRFIETIPRRGYRFIGQIETVQDVAADSGAKAETPAPYTVLSVTKPTGTRLVWVAILVVVLLGIMGFVRHPVAQWLNNHGANLQQQGKLAQAIHYYSWAIRLHPDYPEAHYNLAYSYEELSQYDRAMTHYERSVELDDKFYEAYNNLARLYILRRKDSTAALALLDRALSSNPQDQSVQYSLYKNRGWANFQLQYFGQAERDLKMALALADKRAAAHCLMAQVLEAQQKQSAAIPEWEMCIAYAPGEPGMEPEWLHLAQERLGGK